jgi:hypothetical protein
MKTFSYLRQYLTKLFLEWEIFQKKNAEKIKTHIWCPVTFYENRTVYEIRSKNVVKPEVSQMTSQYGTYALNAG